MPNTSHPQAKTPISKHRKSSKKEIQSHMAKTPESFFINPAFQSVALTCKGEWTVLTDVVMGGRSTASSKTMASEGLEFKGDISLENGGGFGSTKIAIEPFRPASIKCLQFLVRGDGRTYKMSLRSSSKGRQGISYQQSFQTQSGKTIRVILEMEKFLPRAYGQDQGHIPPLFLQDIEIDSVSFVIADKKPGPFFVKVQPISATRYEEAEEQKQMPSKVAEMLETSIVKGAKMFNKSDAHGCAELYRHTIASILSKWKRQLPAKRVRRLRQTLWATQNAHAETQKAWILRYGIDDALNAGETTKRARS